MNNNRKFSHMNVIDTIAITIFTALCALTVINVINIGVKPF